MSDGHRFAIATRDELWSLGANRLLLESRHSHGEALLRGAELIATDARDERLVQVCDARLERARAATSELRDARVRLVVTARRARETSVRDTIVVTRGGISIVSDAEHLSADLPLLGNAVSHAGVVVERDPTLPILWRNGSGAVLLHEAVGHAAEHGHFGGDWPAWLRVTDEPEIAFDDAGVATRGVNLLREPPACLRRESFRDVPLPRMSRVVVSESGAPFALPPARIDIQLVAGGVYEPLTQVVTLFVVHAERVDGDERQRVRPFELRATRADIARAQCGASGQPQRYPGVICSREGQEVVVGSHAPLLLTAFG